jgi:zinc transport system ATP-binding protein
VARALADRPDLLVLDEPTANMDSESEDRLFETLGRLKGETTIIIVTHERNFVSSLTDRVLCLGDRDGRPYGIVQHGTGPDEHGAVRVLHEDSVAGEDCRTGDPKEAVPGEGRR